MNWNVVSNLIPRCLPMGQFRVMLDKSGWSERKCFLGSQSSSRGFIWELARNANCPMYRLRNLDICGLEPLGEFRCMLKLENHYSSDKRKYKPLTDSTTIVKTATHNANSSWDSKALDWMGPWLLGSASPFLSAWWCKDIVEGFLVTTSVIVDFSNK